MSIKKDIKPIIKGWYSIKLKSSLGNKEREEKKLTLCFIDWAYFDGDNWDIKEYRNLGFYVFDIIKAEAEPRTQK